MCLSECVSKCGSERADRCPSPVFFQTFGGLAILKILKKLITGACIAEKFVMLRLYFSNPNPLLFVTDHSVCVCSVF